MKMVSNSQSSYLCGGLGNNRDETKMDFWIFAKSENLTKFREISLHENFRENLGIANIFAKMVKQMFVFANIFA